MVARPGCTGHMLLDFECKLGIANAFADLLRQIHFAEQAQAVNSDSTQVAGVDAHEAGVAIRNDKVQALLLTARELCGYYHIFGNAICRFR